MRRWSSLGCAARCWTTKPSAAGLVEQVEVVARRPHGDCDRAPLDADLERLLDREQIGVFWTDDLTADAMDPDGRDPRH